MVTERSPRALLDMTHQLYVTLHTEAVEEASIELVDVDSKEPQFILFRVEGIMKNIRRDLDMPYQPQEDPDPLMMRIRQHLDCISSVLTGTPIQFQSPDTTTLAELIQCVSFLNRSVCSPAETVWCTVT